jgi:NADH-quinone oxidoreductase subunit L
MELIAVFAPLLGFVIAGLLGHKIGDKGAQFVTCGLMLLAAGASIYLFNDVVMGGDPRTLQLMTWIASGDFQVNWALRVDQLAVVMMCVINIVSACVHIYSVGYMSHDPHKARFMAYLSLFTFAMLMLVTADNLLQLFFGWEGVGVASYLLIGFWYHKHSANAASMKAFIVNRVGDLGLILGIFAVFMVFGTVQFDGIFSQVAAKANATFSFFGHEFHALTVACLLLFIGAVGKSAQLGLHTWLPDAMEGPTPVSALIHAATMVTAGVFLVTRFSPVFEYAPVALMVVCVLGALTAIVAATIGMTQFDIKRVIAYSTMSQLGYMFFALGVSAYSAAMFHLMTHAFFKALLFLGAGSVIHAMSDEQDMRKMGGIWKKIPFTYALMWIGSLALAGVPFFAGFYSKDMILESAWADHTWFGHMAFWLGVTAAFLTAFYSWRLLIMTFHGKPRADHHTMEHVHESPPVMLAPLVVLAIGAVFAGFVFYGHFVGEERAAFWGASISVLAENDTVEAAHHVPLWVKLTPVIAGSLGILAGFIAYMFATGIPARVVNAFRPMHTLFFRKWFFDEAYDAIFVKPAQKLGQFFWIKGDQDTIDGFGPNGIARMSQKFGFDLSRFQSGFVFQYAFVMLIGVFALVTWFVIQSGMLTQVFGN